LAELEKLTSRLPRTNAADQQRINARGIRTSESIVTIRLAQVTDQAKCLGRLCQQFLPYREAFTLVGKPVRKAAGYEQEQAEAALSHIGVLGCARRASSDYGGVSMTHGFLRRGLQVGKNGDVTQKSGGADSSPRSQFEKDSNY
jgi:hypothetical protein